MKMYYLLLDTNVKPLTTPVSTYWCGDNSKADFLTSLRGFVIPLGTKKPRKVPAEQIWNL